MGGRGLCTTCYSRAWKAENAEWMREYNSTNRKMLREGDPNKYRAKARAKYAAQSWAERVRAAGGRMGRRVLSIEFLHGLQQRTPDCECCGAGLDYSVCPKGEPRPNNQANLDKVIPALGYVEGNVAILCFRCNRFKDQMAADDMRRLLSYIDRKSAKGDTDGSE